MKPELLKRLAAAKARPDIAKSLDSQELTLAFAELVSFVQTINKAIETGRLDGKDGYNPLPDKDYMSLATAKKMLEGLQGDFTTSFEEERLLLINTVDERLQQIRDGEDGIVSDEEIERAAQIAASLIELPNFDELKELDSEKVREAFGEISIKDVDGLTEALDTLAQIRSSGGGTIGKSQVYRFIQQAVSDGTIPAGGGISDGDKGDITVSSSGSVWSIDDDTIGLDELSATGTPDGTKALFGDNTWKVPSGSGDVVGPASAVDSNFAAFDSTTGKLIKDSGSAASTFATAAQGATADTASQPGHTHTASEVTDFDTEVSNNASVVANTAKVSNATHTGDVTGDTTLTIADEAVTLPKLAHVATNRFLGRDTAGTGDVESLTTATAKTMLDLTGTNSGDETAASVADVDGGTVTGEYIDPDTLQGSFRNLRFIDFIVVDPATDVATGTSLVSWPAPFAGTIVQDDTDVDYFAAYTTTAGTTGTMVVDIHKNGTTIMTTNKLDIETTELDTTLAATQPDLTTTTFVAGDVFTIDIDAVHTTAAKGLTVRMAVRPD